MKNIRYKIKEWVQKELDINIDFVVEHPKDMEHGDYSCNVALISFLRKIHKDGSGVKSSGPRQTAEEYVAALSESSIHGDMPEIEKIESAGPGFINFFLKPEFFSDMIGEVLAEGEKFGSNTNLSGQKYFIEHTQPNPFKEFHIGHLMNNMIGESLVRIVKDNGAEVKAASYHGDVGVHIAQAIWSLMRDPESFSLAYALGNSAFETDENAKKEILAINKKIYDKTDSHINELYDQGRQRSLEHFETLYDRLDSHFDFHFYESQSGEIGTKLVLEFVDKGVFERGDGGAVIFRGENFTPPTHTRVFLNAEGLPTYEAKEVGLAHIKKEIYPYDFSLTVTANEQDAFFSVVEVAIGQVFPELAGHLKHVSHGLLKLPTGKMSSRTGNVISATSLIDDIKSHVLEKMADRDMSTEEKNAVAEIIAIGALKYSILRQAIGGDIIFDLAQALSFEGDSGPYVQYAYVRAMSVLAKATPSSGKDEHVVSKPENWQTTTVEKLIARFPEVVEYAGREYAPHHLVTYVTELAGAFNAFYAHEKIIDTQDPQSTYKIAITRAVATVLKNGLYLLGIKVPDKM